MNLSAGGDENLINSTPTKKPVSIAENVENGVVHKLFHFCSELCVRPISRIVCTMFTYMFDYKQLFLVTFIIYSSPLESLVTANQY